MGASPQVHAALRGTRHVQTAVLLRRDSRSRAELEASPAGAVTTRDGNTKSHLKVRDLPAEMPSGSYLGRRACLERGHPPQCARLSEPHPRSGRQDCFRDLSPRADRNSSRITHAAAPARLPRPWAPSWNWPPANSARAPGPTESVLSCLAYLTWHVFKARPPRSPHWNFIPVHGE